MIEVSTIRNKKLTLTFAMLGKDINVSLCGGEVPHIGAVSIGHINNAGDVDVKSFGLPTHKEKDIAERYNRISKKAKLHNYTKLLNSL